MLRMYVGNNYSIFLLVLSCKGYQVELPVTKEEGVFFAGSYVSVQGRCLLSASCSFTLPQILDHC